MKAALSDSIVIVGAGAFGLSTALHLVRAGYTNLTVIEKGDSIPPRYSAANDLNKIVRPEYEDKFYSDLTLKAMAAWKTPLFAPYFHQTGFLNCVSKSCPDRAVATMRRFQASAEKHPDIRPHVVPIQSRQDILDQVWQFQDGELPGWRGYLNRRAGYAQSARALAAVYRELRSKGVEFRLGPDCEVTQIVYGASSVDGTKAARGVTTRDDKFHSAGLVIVAAGAWVSQLIPEIGTQVDAKAWSVAHVKVTDDEASVLRNIPVTYARDLGFFFEPDPETNLLKLCPMGGGFVNSNGETGVSLPPDSYGRSAFMPKNDERKVRQLLAQTLPALANRPLVNKALCWFADTSDSDYIVDYVPKTSASVLVVSGDSGHGFKMFPIVGSWVLDLLNAEDFQQHEARWRWKARNLKVSGGDWGDEVSWRLGSTTEFSSIETDRSRL